MKERARSDTKVQDWLCLALWTDMTNHHHHTAARRTPSRFAHHHLGRLAPLAAAAVLLGAACGSSTTTTSPVDPDATSRVVSTDVPVATDEPTSDSLAPATTAPATPTTTIAPAEVVAPCGEFGDLPPLPDGLVQRLFDTDGDGELDSAQTYPRSGDPYADDAQAWTIRVIENGVISEAPIPDLAISVGIATGVEVDGRVHVIVDNYDNNDQHTFGTNADGCIEFLSTEPGDGPGPDPSDDLVATNPTIPVPTIPLPTTPITIDPILVAPTPAPGPCGDFDPIPAASQITSDLTVDLVGDGVADDRVVTYLDGVYKLRSVRNGVTSEVSVPEVGVSSIRALGVGNAGEISVGNEVIVRTGGGASAAEIGIFGHDADGCVFQFTLNGSELEMYVGATIGTSSGMYCGESLIAEWSYELDADGTYFGSSAAFFESSAGDFTYLPGSDDFSEGLTIDELSPATLDCFGFGL